MTATPLLDSLTCSHKRTLVGNLLRSDSLTLGFGKLKWAERDLSFVGLRGLVLSENSLIEPDEVAFTWRPDRVTARYSFFDVLIDETEAVHDDVLIDHITLVNTSQQTRRITLVFRSEFESRKASAKYFADSRTVAIDLSIAQRVHVAIAASIAPNRFALRPYPELVTQDLLTIAPLHYRTDALFLHDQIVPGWRFDFELQPGTSSELVFALACDAVAQTALTKAQTACANPTACFQVETNSWEYYLREEIPSFHCSDPKLEQLWLYTWFVQRANIVRHNDPRFPLAFQMPSKHTYPHLWFWDSAFHALINRWLVDPQIAHNDLRTVAQQQTPNGMIPHEVYLEPGTALGNWPDGDGQASTITQLPIYAHAVWETYRITRDRQLIADLLPVLLRYDAWIARERDRDGDGLMSLMHRWSGWDTSPRWDLGLDIEAVDATCYWFAQKQAIANMARELGDDALAEKYTQDAERIAQSMREKMWDEDAKNFWDLQGADEMPVRIRTLAPLITLPFGIATEHQAQLLTTQLLDPKLFWSRFPIPTVALAESVFDANNYWRGPTWFNQNWLVLDGLRRYGRDDVATQLLICSLDLLTHTGHPSAHEYFNPLTGAELGAVDLGWTGLCNDMIIRHVCGVQRGDDDWKFAPLDIGLDWYELDLPAQKILVRFDRATGYRVAR